MYGQMAQDQKHSYIFYMWKFSMKILIKRLQYVLCNTEVVNFTQAYNMYTISCTYKHMAIKHINYIIFKTIRIV